MPKIKNKKEFQRRAEEYTRMKLKLDEQYKICQEMIPDLLNYMQEKEIQSIDIPFENSILYLKEMKVWEYSDIVLMQEEKLKKLKDKIKKLKKEDIENEKAKELESKISLACRRNKARKK